MRIEKCYFCSGPVYPGHGTMFVRNDAKTFRFCRHKCRRAFEQKRNPRKVRWTKAFRKSAGKEMAVDSTFDFERKRNRIGKYDRTKMLFTLKAIKKVTSIRTRREADFHKQRMKASKKVEQKRAVAELKESADLIRPPVVDRSRVRVSKKAEDRVMEEAG
eukprot:Rmarinus@m.10352